MSALRSPEAERAGYATIAKALARCTYVPGCWDKRFARATAALADANPDWSFTNLQRASLIRLAHRYRRQVATEVVMLAEDLAEVEALKQGALP